MNRVRESDPAPPWLPALRTYFVVMLFGHLLWEVMQLPLYTIWATGTWRDIAFAVAHCTAGDMLIAAVCLLGALLLAGDARWPAAGFARVAGAAWLMGVGYAVFSEWLNVTVRASWAYADAMPVLPWIGTGLAPLLQWMIVPAVAFRMAYRKGGTA